MIITDSRYKDSYNSIIKLKIKNDFDDLEETAGFSTEEIELMNKENEFMDLLNKHFNNRIPSFTELNNFVRQNYDKIISKLKNTPKSNNNKLRTFEFYYNTSIDGSDVADKMLVELYGSNDELMEFINNDLFDIQNEKNHIYYEPTAVPIIIKYYDKKFGNTIPSTEEFKNYILQNKDKIEKEVKDLINNLID